MNAEIIGVGTELLLGHTINSDAAYVARELAALGINVFHSQVVGDNPGRLEKALRESLDRSDIVVTTGGLGPTGDDLTKETIALVAESPLVEDAASTASLAEYFGSREMTENQKKQCFFPQGSTVFPNPQGTAPGCAVSCKGGKIIIMLPGPPRELLPMLENSVRPFLANLGHFSLYTGIIRVFGMGEGKVAHVLGPLLDGANPTAATYAGDGELFVRVSSRAENPEKARQMALPLQNAICEKLGPVVYGIDVPSLEHVVVARLEKSGQSIATAESCTGGLLAGRITAVPGSSNVFEMGLVTYANRIKTELLAVPEEMLARVGAVSPEVGKCMAENVRKLAASDFGVGITGIAGPGGGSREKPVGLVYICVATKNDTFMRVMRPLGRYPGREQIRRRATSHALDMARRIMDGLPMDVDWM